MYESAFGTKPIQLSTIGVNAGIYLDHLADDPEFRGKVIVGYAPGLFFAGGGGPVQTPQDNIRRYETMTLSDYIDFRLAKIFDTRFAFIQPDDLSLKNLLSAVPLKNRAGTVLPPALPPYFYYVDMRRQGALATKVEHDAELAKHIENVWLGLMAPHDTHLPSDLRKKNEEENIARVIHRAVSSVRKIREKGGDVIFVRYPSSGPVRDLENVLTPRARYWDRLVQETEAFSIHFEDHESLKYFHCPEGGHLTQADRGEFTRRLIPLLSDIYVKIDRDERPIYASSSGKQSDKRGG